MDEEALKQKVLEENIYNNEFYKLQAKKSYISAKETLKILFEKYKPKSVVDIGCGVGTWLKACQDFGIKDLQGYDINKVDDSSLYLSRNFINIVDLKTFKNTKDKIYDLAISLEVAEHLPEESADNFIASLTSFSDVILFSAAIPYQGGVNHINEKPLNYWVDKFNAIGYTCFDFLRTKMHKNENIEWWYSQNTLVFVKNEKCNIFTEQNLIPDNEPTFFYSQKMILPIFENMAKEVELRVQQSRSNDIRLTVYEKIIVKILALIMPSRTLKKHILELFKG